jgi:Tol biopolymer transport system component
VAAPPDTRLSQVAISPDGRWLAFAAESASGESHLWVRRLAGHETRMLAGTEGAREPFWSPDSRFLGFFGESRLSKVEVATGAVEALVETSDTRGGTWSAQDTIVFGGGKLNRVAASGGAVSTALAADTAAGENALRYPCFLPDGKHVVFYARNPKDRARAGLWVLALDTGERKLLTASAASSAVYVEPGHLLYRRDRYLLAHPFDARRIEFTGEARPIAEDLWYDPGVTSLTNVSASATGIVTYRTGGEERSELVWQDREGRRLGTEWEPRGFAGMSLSPDGRQILASFPGDGVERYVWLYDLPTATARQVTSGGDTVNLTFADDGQRAFLGMYAGSPGATTWRVRLGSGGEPELLTAKGRGEAPSLVMDARGDHVVYVEYLRGEGRSQRSLFDLDLATREARALVDTPADEMFGSLSPDGRRLAYASDASGQWEVYVQTYPEAKGRWRVSAKGGHQPRWSRDGSELFYIAPDRQLVSVRVRGAGEGFQWDAPRPLFQTAIVDLGPFRGHWGYAVAPDGKRFLILTRRPQGPSPAVAIVGWK